MHFGLMLQMNTGLKQVHFGMHQIHDSGVAVLVHYLVENRTLLRLDLSSNQIGWRGAQSLAVLLQEDCLLEELNLAHNRLALEEGDGWVRNVLASLAKLATSLAKLAKLLWQCIAYLQIYSQIVYLQT